MKTGSEAASSVKKAAAPKRHCIIKTLQISEQILLELPHQTTIIAGNQFEKDKKYECLKHLGSYWDI